VEFGATRLLDFFPARSGLNEFGTYKDQTTTMEQVLAADFGTKVTFVFPRRSAWGADFFVFFIFVLYLPRSILPNCYN